MRLIGYVRASTEDQKLTLSAQEIKIRAGAVVQDAELVEVVVDSESGKNLQRPGIQRILEMARRKTIDGVMVAKLDRLTRSVRDLADIVELFNRKEIRLISLGESLDTGCAAGRMMMNILATVAQWERETISERTSEALQESKRQGKRAGNLAYGWAVDRDDPKGKLVPYPPEQLVVGRIRKLNAEGLSLRGIAKRLNEDGVVTRSGGEWQYTYVRNVLKREELNVKA